VSLVRWVESSAGFTGKTNALAWTSTGALWWSELGDVL